jgi:hypothetical protein
VAFACRLSFQRGHESNNFVAVQNSTNRTLRKNIGAIHFGGRIMIIGTKAALKLIDRYFKNSSI